MVPFGGVLHRRKEGTLRCSAASVVLHARSAFQRIDVWKRWGLTYLAFVHWSTILWVVWVDNSICTLRPANKLLVELGGGEMRLAAMGMLAVRMCKKPLKRTAIVAMAIRVVV